MAGPEHADLVPPPAFGFGAAHLRAAAPAASQPRPLHRGSLDPSTADRTGGQQFIIRCTVDLSPNGTRELLHILCKQPI